MLSRLSTSSLLLLAGEAASFFILPCSRPVVVQRADPIVEPGKVAAHAHTVMGGNGFNFTMDYDSARASSCSTCSVKEDLSNYWIPNLYYRRQDGGFESVKQNGGMLVYYLQRTDPKDPEYDEGLTAFPEGFQMLAGDPHLRSYSDTLEQQAVSYACLGRDGPETPGIPNHDCPSGLRTQIVFPSCWDGENLDSSDHKSHMAYPSLMNNGRCPETHPKRFVTLFYEVTFDIQDFADRWYGDEHPFVFSQGDPTGYGLHGDFVNGWDLPILQEAIDQCDDAGGQLDKCTVLEQFDNSVTDGCKVPAQVDEPVNGVLEALPGCNSVQTGPQRAAPQMGCGAPETVSEAQLGFTDATKSNGYKFLGCATGGGGGNGRMLEGADTANDEMTVGECFKFCESSGSEFQYAGLEYGRECYCGNSVDGSRMPVKGVLGTCEMPCSGDEDEVCGGYGRLSLYEKCASGEDCLNAALM